MHNVVRKIILFIVLNSSLCYHILAAEDLFIGNDSTYVKIENNRYIGEDGEFKVRIFDKVDISDLMSQLC